jgi:hypothetical protein
MSGYSIKMTVHRKGEPVEVEADADVDGDIVAISSVTRQGKRFPLDDNETNAARCLVLNLAYPKMEWDKRAANLLRIAKLYPEC